MSDDTLRDPEAEQGLSETEKADLIRKVLSRYENGVGAFEENRRMFSEDLRFAFDSEGMGQWAPETLAMRKGRPSYTFNRVIGPINMVIADQRQSRPSAKFRAASDQATEATAEVYAGLFRAMERDSRADTIYDMQFKYAVAGGFGEWRLVPEYAANDETPEAFEQCLYLRNISNPLTVVRDPECVDPCGGDAMWCIVADRISKDKYKELYPKGNEQSFTMSRDSWGWFTDKEVRIAEYWERVATQKTVALLDDGRVVEYTAAFKKANEEMRGLPGVPQVVRTRDVLDWKVRWLKCDGANILEGPIEYNWKRIPIVRVPGRYVNIEGRQKYQSLIRHSKDSQRSYNFRRSDMIERSSLIPKAPYMVTAKMINGFEDIWATANTVPRPYLPYNVDKDAPDQKPVREAPVDLPQGALALAQQDAADIQATTGFFDPALGNAEDMNRVSGKALVQHTRRSDLGSYEFIDGFGKALQLTAEMFADMVPTVYDTQRVVRIIGQDETEKLVTVNHDQGPAGIMNDLVAGRYNVTVTLGPSYQTARQEALATLIEAAHTIPQIGQVAPDLVAKNIDSPDADEIARRLRLPLLHAGVVQPTPQEAKAMAAQPPQQPNPMQIAELQVKQAEAAQEMAKAHIEASKASTGQLHAHELEVKTAQMHLENIKLAQEIGQANLAAQAEAQAAAFFKPPQQ